MDSIAPLPGTFMLTSIIGFIVSALYVTNLSKTWGFTFCLVFGLMFVASFISTIKADVEKEIALDEMAFKKKKKKS